MTAKSDPNKVCRRIVLYYAGFEPRGASTYHEMTRREFEKHCHHNGLTAHVTTRKRIGKQRHDWLLTAENDDNAVLTEFRFIVWDDLVRAHWIRSDWLAVWRGAQTFLSMTKLGIFSHMQQTSWPISLTMAGPLIQVAGYAISAILGLLSLFWLVSSAYVAGFVGLVAAVGVFGSVGLVISRSDAAWIGRITTFALATARRPVFENWPNRANMGKSIVEALNRNDCEEVLVVSHSIGTQLGLLAMADAIKSEPLLVKNAVEEDRLSFLTLGQTVPLMSRISSIIADSLSIVGKSNICWLDVSAPADPACCALVDPYRDQFDGKPRVNVQNARFFQGFTTETYRKARENRFTMHFLYLMSPDATESEDRKLCFDLYQLMASDKLLARQLPARPNVIEPFFARKTNR